MKEVGHSQNRHADADTHTKNSAQIEPFWHAWISYAVDTPPTIDPLAKTAKSWAKPFHIPNYTATRGAYKPYNTYVHTQGREGLGTELTDSITESSRRSIRGSLLPSSDKEREGAANREVEGRVHKKIDNGAEWHRFAHDFTRQKHRGNSPCVSSS